MRRALLAAVLMLFALNAFAQSSSVEMRVNMLIDDGLYRNMDEITAEALGLNQDQRYMLYSAHEEDPMIPFVLSLLVGMGVGSYVQGDLTGGLISTGLDLAGIAAVYVGYMMLATTILDDPYDSMYDMPVVEMSLILGGVAVISFSRVFQLVRPFTYAERYNHDLRIALQM